MPLAHAMGHVLQMQMRMGFVMTKTFASDLRKIVWFRDARMNLLATMRCKPPQMTGLVNRCLANGATIHRLATLKAWAFLGLRTAICACTSWTGNAIARAMCSMWLACAEALALRMPTKTAFVTIWTHVWGPWMPAERAMVLGPSMVVAVRSCLRAIAGAMANNWMPLVSVVGTARRMPTAMAGAMRASIPPQTRTFVRISIRALALWMSAAYVMGPGPILSAVVPFCSRENAIVMGISSMPLASAVAIVLRTRMEMGFATSFRRVAPMWRHAITSMP